MEITFDAVTIWQLVLSTLLPLAVGLVTKIITNSSIKAVLLLFFALIGSLVAEIVRALQEGQVFDLGQALILTLPTFLIGVGMHYGIWKPTGASFAVQAVGSNTQEDTYITDEPTV